MNLLPYNPFSAVSLLAYFMLMLCGMPAKAQSHNTQVCVEEPHNYICGFVHDKSGELIPGTTVSILYTDGTQLPGAYDTVATTEPDAQGHFVITVPEACANPRLTWLEVVGNVHKPILLRLADLSSYIDLDIISENNWVFSDYLIVCRNRDIIDTVELKNHCFPGSYYNGKTFDRRGGMNGVWRDLMPAPGSEIRR